MRYLLVLAPEVTDPEVARAYRPFSEHALPAIIMQARTRTVESIKGTGRQLTAKIHTIFPYYFVGWDYEGLDNSVLQLLRDKTHTAFVDCASLDKASYEKRTEDVMEIVAVFSSGPLADNKHSYLLDNDFADKQQYKIKTQRFLVSDDNSLGLLLQVDLIRSDPKINLLTRYYPGP